MIKFIKNLFAGKATTKVEPIVPSIASIVEDIQAKINQLKTVSDHWTENASHAEDRIQDKFKEIENLRIEHEDSKAESLRAENIATCLQELIKG